VKAETTLRKLQLVELEILDKFVQICEDHGLIYFLAYGTLLGAIRHHGFIPWDDDVDVGMPREDYEKLIEICRNKQPAGYFLQEGRIYIKYWHIYAKFRKNNTRKIEPNPPPFYPNEHRGINIDVFPYDVVSSNHLILKIQEFLLRRIRFLLFEKRGYKSDGSKFLIFIKQLISRMISFNVFHGLSHAIMTFGPGKSCNITSWGSTEGYRKETFSRKVIFPTTKTEFEGRRFAIPNDSHFYLKQIYGNYMQPPSVAERNTYDAGIVFDIEKSEKGTFNE
jgi:lipopolysaccharide cholinephosphotransferase